MKALTPDTIAPPFANYSHGVEVSPRRLVLTSGQLGIDKDGQIPDGSAAQAEICFGNIDAILAEAGLDRADILRINAFVTAREHMAGYMAVRDRYLDGVPVLPASTLMVVSGFTKPEFVVEIEVMAAESA
ncbi:RidA family protein [Shimia sp. SDUM112013]|uniref:RidA family protein n=1 Tax=Shimia sp. SDUM112013 TaxID=3136160 RepID=UPI0032ECDF90